MACTLFHVLCRAKVENVVHKFMLTIWSVCRLGENPGFLLVFYQFVADRFKESEYTGSLIASILEVRERIYFDVGSCS